MATTLRYVTIVRERWRTTLITALIVLGTIVAATSLQRPEYEASASIFVRTGTGASVMDRAAAADYVSQQIETYTDLVTTPLVLDPAIESLGLETGARQLSEDVSATVPDDTLLITITARAGTAEDAAALANAVGESLQTQVSDLEATSGPTAVHLTTVTHTTRPERPASPNVPLNVALGALAAALAGALIALLRGLMDDKVRNVQDIHPLTDSPILATIPAEKSDHAVMPMPDLEGHGRNAEAYRELRTNLRYLGMRCRLRSMLVTSSVKGEGKSVTSINLASTLARSDRRVLLIDADLRAPSLHRHLTLQSEAGLTTVLLGEAALDDVVQPVELDGLSVLTTGPAPPNPSELLDSDQMTLLLKAATARYDTLIVDSAPLLPVADRTTLAQRVSGTLMVVGSGRGRRPHLAQALRKLEIVQLPILGIVLNRVPRRGLSAYSEPYGAPAESARNLAGVSHSGRHARTMTSAPDSSTSTSSVPGPSERKRTS